MVRVASHDAPFVVLVKPQFEAPRSRVGPGGVVRDPAVWGDAIETVAAAFADQGVTCAGLVVSSKPGPAGNVEFVLAARRGGPGLDLPEAIRGATREALVLGGAA
jgi:23S rRNA (cytidine1920-2'-O)/16S rRNA (cytidine1409-2'-O)-methyltransferase